MGTAAFPPLSTRGQQSYSTALSLPKGLRSPSAQQSWTLTGVTSVHSPPSRPHWTPSPPPSSQERAHFTPLGTTIPSGLQCVSLEVVAPLDPQGERRIPLTRHYSRPLSSPSVLFWSLSVGIEHNLLTAFENPGKTLNVTVESDSATPWTVVRQGPLSMGFFRQEYWSGLLCPPPGNLPHPGTEPWSPALQADLPAAAGQSLQLCPTLCDPMDFSL